MRMLRKSAPTSGSVTALLPFSAATTTAVAMRARSLAVVSPDAVIGSGRKR
jgi:hypothetical protein